MDNINFFGMNPNMEEKSFVKSKEIRCIFTVIFIILFAGCGLSSNDNYYNNTVIAAAADKYSAQNFITNFESGNSTIINEIGNMSGHITLAYANIKDECDAEIYISIKATHGKAKLVLVKPNLEVEVLKEVIADGESNYDGNIPFHCDRGNIKIKIVGDNCGLELKISQNKDLLFTYPRNEEFDGDSFPFGSGIKT